MVLDSARMPPPPPAPLQAWWTFTQGKGRAGQRKWRSAKWSRQLQTEKPTMA